MRELGPRYWREEVSAIVANAVETYLSGEELTERQLQLMRLYLGQWVSAPIWDQNPHGAPPELADLRKSVFSLENRAQIHDGIWQAMEAGIDPL